MEEAIAMTYDFAEIERKKGELKGEIKGEIKTFIQLIKDGLITLQQAAERMNITTDKFKELASEYGLMQ